MSERTSQYTFVCFPCRYTARGQRIRHPLRCPRCRQALENVGKKFPTPAKRDDKGWSDAEAWVRRVANQQRHEYWVALCGERLNKTWAARRPASKRRAHG